MNEIDTDGKPLVDEWSGIQHLKQFRNDIRVLEAMRRFKHKPHEVEHFTKLKTKGVPPKYKTAGGHTIDAINPNGFLDPTDSTLPLDFQSKITAKSKNGKHINYEPMWYRFPLDPANPGKTKTPPTKPTDPSGSADWDKIYKEYPASGSGVWYKS